MQKLKKLTNCQCNKILVISFLEIKDFEILNRLFALGLYPKAKIKIISKKSIYILDIRGSRLTIPLDIAEKIFVEEKIFAD